MFVEAIARLAEFASRADAAPRAPHDMRVTITFRHQEHRARFLAEVMREIDPSVIRHCHCYSIRADHLTLNGIDVRIPE